MNEEMRNEQLDKLLIEMVANSREPGLCAADILISYMNNVMIQDERDEIMELLRKED